MHDEKPRASLWQDAAMVLRGMAMGAADVVPGVSGGTVALVVGIYRRLVTAISHVDFTLLNLVRQRQWKAAAQRVDLRFMVFLMLGIATGILVFARVMKFLLEFHPEPTLAVFFGLISVSCILVARMVRHWTLGAVLLALVAAGAAFWLTGLLPTEAEVTYHYLFICGMIAICAMILPGISGAFVLLILGMYPPVIGVVGEVARGRLTGDNLVFLAIFGSGCALGLIGFSKILKVLLVRFESLTMAALAGFMLGSLRRVWPFQVEGQNFFPQVEQLGLPALLAAAAVVAVLTFDAVARRIGAAQAQRDAAARAEASQAPPQRDQKTSQRPPRETMPL